MWGSDGEDLMFGLATMAAVRYLSGSSALMRLSAEIEEERGGEGMRSWGGEQRESVQPHTPLLPMLLLIVLELMRIYSKDLV